MNFEMTEAEREHWRKAIEYEKRNIESYNSGWANGVDGLPLDGGPNCELCRNKRHVYHVDEKLGHTYIVFCKCKEVVDTMRKIRASGLGDVIDNLTFERFETKTAFQRQVRDLAREYVDAKTKNWFAIFGQSGAGKTHICTAICGELLKRGHTLTYLRWAVELKRIKMYGGGSWEYSQELSKIFCHDVIYIDDLFKCSRGRTPTDAEIDLAFEIIDTAQSMNKILILSGEMFLEQMRNLDEATAGRIKRQCGKYLLQIPHDGAKNYRFGDSL